MYQATAKDIVLALNQDIEGVVRHLLPNGKRQAGEWCVGSVNGETGLSLKVCLEGAKRGVWKDFGDVHGGDLLNLWCLTRNLSLYEAILEAKQWLGISMPAFSKPVVKQKKVLKLIEERSVNQNSKVGQYLINERKLSLETLQYFKIQENQNEIAFPYYVDSQLKLIKYLGLIRQNGKKSIRTTPDCQPCLFGWQADRGKSRKAVLTEGEIDAMTLFQYQIGMTVLSLPFGGGTNQSHTKHQWVEHEFERLAVYDEILLCLDNDQQGHEAAKELIERLGRHRCRIVQLPYKDANECLIAGVSRQEILNCLNEARSLDPEELKSASLYVDQVIEIFNPTDAQILGYCFPWHKSYGKILFRPAELSLWTGINGHGKSQCLGQLILCCMQQGARVCIASLELKPKLLLSRLTRQVAGLREPTNEFIRVIHEWYDEKLWIFDLVGTAKSTRIIDVFKYARQRYGIDTFVIDSFMKCGISEEDYPTQKLFIDQLCDFKNEFNCHVHLVVHPRKNDDELKPPGKLDMKGTGAISDLADNCFTVWRNKSKESEVQRCGEKVPSNIREMPDALLICDKQRNGEWEGRFALWFDRESFQYLESQNIKPVPMIDYSGA